MSWQTDRVIVKPVEESNKKTIIVLGRFFGRLCEDCHFETALQSTVTPQSGNQVSTSLSNSGLC